MTESIPACRPGRILHVIEIGITKYEPFRAFRLKIDLHPRMGSLPLTIENDTVAKLAMADALAEFRTPSSAPALILREPPRAWPRRTRSLIGPADLNARPDFLDQFRQVSPR